MDGSFSCLADYTSPGLLVPCLKATHCSEAMRELSAAMQREGFIADSLAVYHAALNHEMLGAAPVTDGWAMPHARMNQGRRVVFAAGKPAHPLRWFDGSPANLIILSFVPEAGASDYLRVISAFARLLLDPKECALLMAASTPEEMREVFARVALRGAGPAAPPKTIPHA